MISAKHTTFITLHVYLRWPRANSSKTSYVQKEQTENNIQLLKQRKKSYLLRSSLIQDVSVQQFYSLCTISANFIALCICHRCDMTSFGAVRIIIQIG